MSLYDRLSKELFQILKGSGHSLVLFDIHGKRTYEPNMARRMFAKDSKIMISVHEAGPDSQVSMYLSPSADIDELEKLISTLRNVATRYNVLFNVRKYGRELRPKDFAFQAEPMGESVVLESMWGSTKTSYQRIGTSRLIIRHSDRVNEEVFGSRSRNIKAIFVENDMGERFLLQYPVLRAARAVAEHVSRGGTFYDNVSQRIVEMAQEYMELGDLTYHARRVRNELTEDGQRIVGQIVERRRAIRRCLEGMRRPRTYGRLVAEFANPSPVQNEDIITMKKNKVREQLQVADASLDSSLNWVAKLAEEAPSVLFHNVYREQNPEASLVDQNVRGIAQLGESWCEFSGPVAGPFEFREITAEDANGLGEGFACESCIALDPVKNEAFFGMVEGELRGFFEKKDDDEDMGGEEVRAPLDINAVKTAARSERLSLDRYRTQVAEIVKLYKEVVAGTKKQKFVMDRVDAAIARLDKVVSGMAEVMRDKPLSATAGSDAFTAHAGMLASFVDNDDLGNWLSEIAERHGKVSGVEKGVILHLSTMYSKSLAPQFEKMLGTLRSVKQKLDGMNKEERQMESWFEQFDPLKIIERCEEDEKEEEAEEKVEENIAESIRASVVKALNEGFTFDVAVGRAALENNVLASQVESVVNEDDIGHRLWDIEIEKPGRIEGNDNIAYNEERAKGALKKVTAVLSASPSAAFTKLARRYKRVDNWLKKLTEERNKMNDEVKEAAMLLFNESDEVCTRVVETCSLTIQLSAASTRTTRKFDDKKFLEGIALLDGMTEELAKQISQLAAACTTVSTTNVSPSLKVTDPTQESAVFEGFGDRIRGFIAKIAGGVKAWLAGYDSKLAKLRSIVGGSTQEGLELDEAGPYDNEPSDAALDSYWAEIEAKVNDVVEHPKAYGILVGDLHDDEFISDVVGSVINSLSDNTLHNFAFDNRGQVEDMVKRKLGGVQEGMIEEAAPTRGRFSYEVNVNGELDVPVVIEYDHTHPDPANNWPGDVDITSVKRADNGIEVLGFLTPDEVARLEELAMENEDNVVADHQGMADDKADAEWRERRLGETAGGLDAAIKWARSHWSKFDNGRNDYVIDRAAKKFGVSADELRNGMSINEDEYDDDDGLDANHGDDVYHTTIPFDGDYVDVAAYYTRDDEYYAPDGVNVEVNTVIATASGEDITHQVPYDVMQQLASEICGVSESAKPLPGDQGDDFIDDVKKESIDRLRKLAGLA